MAQIKEHLSQATRNFKFLETVNTTIGSSTDWQVTICFYTAVHVINAHLAEFNLHYQSHESVKHAINPYGSIAEMRLTEEAYVAYGKLRSLSRRSRYLVNEESKQNEMGSFTYDVHLAKALRNLNKILDFYCSKYNYKIDPITIKCIDLKQGENLAYYKLI